MGLRVCLEIRSFANFQTDSKIAQGRVPACGIVEALNVIEHVCLRVIARAVGLRPIGSVFSEEKKLSIAALSQTSPDRLIEQVTLLSAISRWNFLLVYWLPWSE